MIPSALSAQLLEGLTDFLRYSFWSSTPGMERVMDDLVVESGRANQVVESGAGPRGPTCR